KAHKIQDRVDDQNVTRIDDKDAADVFRIMQVTSPQEVAATLRMLRNHPVSSDVTTDGIVRLRQLFGRPSARGNEMASRALQLAMAPETIATVASRYIEALSTALEEA